MGDLISREKALALVMSVCDDLIINCGSHYDEEADGYVLDDIKEFDAILKCNKGIRMGLRKLPDEPRWTPISEGLPEERINKITGDLEYVLCSMKNGNVVPYKFGSKIGQEDKHFFGMYGGEMDDDVVAWMYFPEVYVPNELSDIKPIDYQDCCNAMLRMWMDNVVTDGEYNHIMDKLNKHWVNNEKEAK